MEFRKDINGLRAIAVLAVAIFHFNQSVLPGGFIGVDVFFAISGFLMTAIIYGGLDSGRFSVWSFYKARARRIVPALVAVILVLIVYGWIYMFTTEFKSLSKHAVSSLLFFSNITYWKESSYFAPGAEQNWLIHTWSLSVEWQFYLIYPIFIVAIRKICSDKVAKLLILSAAVLSFAISVYASRILVSSSFYLLPTRAWEMMAGGAVFLYPLKRGKGLPLELVGLILIIASALLFNGDYYWPSYNALLPVIGAMLIIMSRSENGILSRKPFQILGSSSYSVYLWHWPIYVFMYNYFGGVGTLGMVVGIALSIVIGYISYIFVEVPCKNKGKVLNKIYYISCLSLSLFIFHANGLKSDYRSISHTEENDLVEHYDGYKFDAGGLWDKCNASERLKNIDSTCVDKKSHGGVFLWGDSHAGSLSLGIRSLLAPNVPFNQLAASSCKPSLDKNPGVISATIGCNFSNEKAIRDIESIKPEFVFLAQRFEHEKTDWNLIAKKLHSLGVKNVILIGPIPQWKGSLPLIVAKNYSSSSLYIGHQYLDERIVNTNSDMKKINNRDYIYVDLFSSLCKVKESLECRARVDEGFTLMSMDYGHLTDEGSTYIGKSIISSYLPKSFLR